jgi:probable F420-dependent oxidoreductase
MRVGLHALGIGSGADPRVIRAVATAADVAGFSTLWSGEHIVMIDRPDSPYPYSPDGRIAVPSDADWLDPLAALAFMAALTSRIRLATGILLLAEHNPILTAKQAATLDVLSSGRFALGVGIGWSSAEFAAIGVPFDERVARTREHVEVMRTLWQEGEASFDGEFTQFRSVRCYPKPVNNGRVPVILGGNSDRALARVAAYGDGWYGFNLSMDEVPDRVDHLATRCRETGRDVASLHVAASIHDATVGDLQRLTELGVDELVVVEAPPADPEVADRWVASLARDWDVVPSH